MSGGREQRDVFGRRLSGSVGCGGCRREPVGGRCHRRRRALRAGRGAQTHAGRALGRRSGGERPHRRADSEWHRRRRRLRVRRRMGQRPFSRTSWRSSTSSTCETFETYTTGKSTFVYEGKVTRFEAPLLPLPAADLAEVAATIAQFDLMAAEVPVDAPWTAPQAAAWDAQTMATWLDDNIICRREPARCSTSWSVAPCVPHRGSSRSCTISSSSPARAARSG